MRISLSRRTGRRRDAECVLSAGVGIAHLGEENGQVALLLLGRPMLGVELIQMLPGAAEGLPQCLGLLAQPDAVGPFATSSRPR